MQKQIKLIFLLAFSAVTSSLSSAQATILDQSLLTDQSFNAFTTVNVTGAQTWHPSSVYGAVCSGYFGGQNFDNEDWLISPAMNLLQVDNARLTFSHTRGSAPVVNVGVQEGWYKVFATSDFSGDPATTQWIELTGINQNVPVAWQYIPSGELVIPDVAKSANSRIAFRYFSSAGQSATWEIKNVKVTGEPQATNPNAGVFKITNWNVEWLGCTTFGPTDETLQINNVVAAMLSMNSDIYCIQEVSNTVSSPSIATLVSLMGSDQWDGKIVPSTTGDCDQRQGIIYKKSRVQFVGSQQLSNGNAAQGNSYYFNWASGRYPALYNLNLVAGNTLVPVTIVNIHAKAEDGDAMSYTRRLGASEALKTILDGSIYNTENLMIIGDFNDYLSGTSSSACGCTTSPYGNFMDDTGHYNGITQLVTNAWGNGNPLIEHVIISDELFGNYVSDSAVQEIAAAQSISNYYGTTSHHLPVSTVFQFSVLDSPEFADLQENALAIYPNPTKSELKFDMAGFENNTIIEVFDFTGRQINCEQTNANTVDVSILPSGIYILKVDKRYGRFVKQ
jgi:endonuclease/exonuclease/phosphatase family metal-dependent hydrolase